MKPLALVVTLTTFSILFIFSGSHAAAPAHFWSRSAGGAAGNEAVNGIAVVPVNSDVVITGYYNGTLNLGSGDLTTPDNSTNGYVARYNNRGELKWVKSFGSINSDVGVNVAVDAPGNVFLVGTFSNSVNLGGSDIYGNGGQDLFIAKFDPLGEHVWSYGFGGSGSEQAPGIVLDGSSNVILAGVADGTTNLGGGPVPTVSQDAFIVKYNSNGAWQWNVFGAGAGAAVGYSVAVDGSGNIYGIGYFQTSVTFSPNPALIADGTLDAYIVKYNSAGTLQWSQRRGGSGDDILVDIASDASGNIVVSGAFTGTTNFGGSNLVSNAGSYDIVLAKYNASGVHQWSNRYGGTGLDLGASLTLLGSGSILLGGYVSPGANLGGGVIPGSGELDIFVAKFGTTGGYAWDRSFGGGGEDRGNSIAADASGNAYIGAFFQSAMNPGGGVITSNGFDDLYFGKFGGAEPAISTVKDIGNDQGRSVRITLTRSPLDDGTAAFPITEYQAFRRVLPLPSALTARGAAAVPPGTWEYVTSVPASNAGSYRIVASTLADSTVENGMYWTKFFVRAATDNPSVFYDSPPDSGYSLDNLAPGIPQGFAFEDGALTWEESPAGDFDYFSVYGSNSNSFGAATLIDYTVAPALDVSAAAYPYYFVTATDFAGNEGKPAVATSLTGAGGTPGKFVLSVSAYPNPFNPETTVRYTVPARGPVELAVYDLRGERVTTLVDRDHAPGAFTATWNGRNVRGEAVGSGVYFARLAGPGGTRTYKLVLLK